jgi:dienelactone hydrolase
MDKPKNNQHYSSKEHLLRIFDEYARKMGFQADSLAAYSDWKDNLRKKLSEILGLDRLEKCDLCPQLLETEQLEGYRRDKVIIQTEPDVWMPFYILIPDSGPGRIVSSGRRPCMIAPHGHKSGGKYATAGRDDLPAVREAIKRFHYDYGVQYVKDGFIAFCPDARGFGERKEQPRNLPAADDLLNSNCSQLNNIAIALGLSLTGQWTWDLMRLVDYITTREDCDAEKIGCGGLSGGGLQTLWLATMDDRIKCAIVSGYFYGYRDSLLKLSENCGCNYLPHLWEYVDMGDLGAMIAPRPLLIETGAKDPLNGGRGLMNVLEQVDTTRKAYQLLGVEDQLWHDIFDGEHCWHGEKTGAFIDQYLR